MSERASRPLADEQTEIAVLGYYLVRGLDGFQTWPARAIDFTPGPRRATYEAMERLAARREAIELPTVHAELAHDRLAPPGISGVVLADYAEQAATSPGMLLGRLRDLTARRMLARACEWGRRAAHDGEQTADATIERMLADLAQLTATGTRHDGAASSARDNPWSRAISAAALLAEVDTVLDWLEPRLLSPEAITQWYSPRGLGKTQIALAIAIRLARAGHRVLLLDRDNPQREVKRRLRAWGAETLATLDVMTRDDVPHLLDRSAWAQFPRGKYELVIIDSWDAASEGVGEQDSAKPSQATATVNDLAHVAGGPAVLVLGNTVKSGAHGRGSGVVEDRGDIVYEVRDATDLQPSGTRAWWAELPPAGRDAWVDRAGRRKHRERCRLAFVPSKFRLGEEPDPFALELDFTATPWSMRDVTAELVAAGEAAAAEAKDQAAAVREAAITRLRSEVEARAAAKEPPYTSKRAVAFLRAVGIARDKARGVLDAGDGQAWRLSLGGKIGSALLVLPLADDQAAPPEASPPATPAATNWLEADDGQNRGNVTDQPEASPPSEVPAAHGFAEGGSFRTVPGADRKLPPFGTPCAAGASETPEASGGLPRKTPPDASACSSEASELSQDPEIPPEDGVTLEDVRAVFPGAQVIADGQPDVWPPAEIIEPTTDPLVLLARAKGTPCVPLAPGLTIVGADWAWQHFAATASLTDRAAARHYLEQLGEER